MSRKLPPINPLIPQEIRKLEDLGQIVRNQRAQARLRIDDAAALCFVSSDLLSRLENGRPITMDKLLKVLDGLGLRMLVVPACDAVLLKSELEALGAGRRPSGDLSNMSGRDE
ncbi:MAG: helix-turn-helix transcriptional regulator [Rhodoferax sp.]|uniref:helix-turn-helix domain-containing protein n=1 Tax=Rhodoferax sp. TaxID=50421 RepID=UPI0027326907|nr:helix-turn-helix transcriptional regulator [Rhodoferax sp.]MDP2680388.1 helix-turn-helix transcriptional regulator [Rhodoferax sp.]